MAYRFVTERRNHADLASGAVLRSAPGLPAFPVRLASEVLQQASALWGGTAPAVVWDPCCGSGYLLTVLGLLHRDRIAALLASDVDERALAVARANLALLTAAGLEARTAELTELAALHGKASHGLAVAAAQRLRGGRDVPATIERADVFDRPRLAALAAAARPDLVITDVPYGEQVAWAGGGGVAGLLDGLHDVLAPGVVIAVVARGRRVPAGAFRPVRTLRVGTRAVALFRVGAGVS